MTWFPWKSSYRRTLGVFFTVALRSLAGNSNDKIIPWVFRVFTRWVCKTNSQYGPSKAQYRDKCCIHCTTLGIDGLTAQYTHEKTLFVRGNSRCLLIVELWTGLPLCFVQAILAQPPFRSLNAAIRHAIAGTEAALREPGHLKGQTHFDLLYNENLGIETPHIRVLVICTCLKIRL